MITVEQVAEFVREYSAHETFAQGTRFAAVERAAVAQGDAVSARGDGMYFFTSNGRSYRYPDEIIRLNVALNMRQVVKGHALYRDEVLEVITGCDDFQEASELLAR